jgi:hypothetical protein
VDIRPSVLSRESGRSAQKKKDEQYQHGNVRLTFVPAPSRLSMRISPP